MTRKRFACSRPPSWPPARSLRPPEISGPCAARLSWIRGQGDVIIAELRALRAEVATLAQPRGRAGRGDQAAAAQTSPGPARDDDDAAAPAAPAPPPAPAQQIAFRGAPTITAPGGWSFKPRGRLQYDVGWVSSPSGISDPGLGFANELRRARLGVEGTIPGGFGYTFELDFADNSVEIVDAFLNYRASDELALTVGQHNNFQSLDELTSSRFSSFIERAAFTDAFNFERRVGISGTWTSGELIAQRGIFTDNVVDLEVGRQQCRERRRPHRLRAAPWRDPAPSRRVRAFARHRRRRRPRRRATASGRCVHTTDVRFLATPALNVESESDYGLEAALIRGPFHAAAEAHWFEADSIAAGLSPTFFGGYAEIGCFLTGESRGYRGGRWDRTTVRRPVGGGDMPAPAPSRSTCATIISI